MKKPKEFCPHCKRPYMQNLHTFSKSLAQIILKVTRNNKEGQPFHLQKDMQLSSNQYANFQKLQYWGLVEKHYEGNKRRGGYWHLTHKAQYLLDGQAIPKSITTFKSEIVSVSKETVIMKEVVGFYDIPNTWAKRQEAVRVGQMEMF